jgi:hypothetical protein
LAALPGRSLLLKSVSLPFAYAAIFTIAAAWFVLGTVLVRRVRGID